MTDVTARLPIAPIRLAPNRIDRFYRGGALLERFRGAAAPRDGTRPEDWVGSVTQAYGSATGTGISRLADGSTIAELVRRDPVGMLGDDAAARNPTTTGVLVKLLDSVVRLPVHCHPTREFAASVLGSAFGKAEAWIILATRQVAGEPPPHVGIGFRDGVARRKLRRWIEEQNVDAMLAALDRHEVVAGDVVFVPPGRPHAIGAGVFMVEVQEPTDFSIVTETRGVPIEPEDAHLRLGWDRMIEAVERAPLAGGIEALRRSMPAGTPEQELSRVDLLPPEAAPFFRAERIEVRGRDTYPLSGGCSILIVVGGTGALRSPLGAEPLGSGDTIFVPAAAASALTIEGNGLVLIACRPPLPELLPRPLRDEAQPPG